MNFVIPRILISNSDLILMKLKRILVNISAPRHRRGKYFPIHNEIEVNNWFYHIAELLYSIIIHVNIRNLN
jgi:hypothetical protein